MEKIGYQGKIEWRVMNIYKSYKIRLYPTREQEQKIWQHIHTCRYIWNYMLALQMERYKNGEKYLSRFDMMKCLTLLKQDTEMSWLKSVSAISLQKVCLDLDRAYNLFFKKRANSPKFKNRKRNKASFSTRCDSLWFNKSNVNIEKIGKIIYKTDFEIPFGKNNKFINPRVSNQNGKWMLSFGMECENQAPVLTDKPMGIDLGIKETMTVAYGNEQIVFHNINKSRKVRLIKKQIKHLQRSISRKYEANQQGSKYIKTKNIERLEERLRKMHARLANIRSNYIHQCTHKLVSLLPSKVVMEDLNIQGMMQNKHLSKSIQEQCFFEIIRQMKYKCEWNGIPFYQVDSFYPSSKTCSCCGHVKSDLKLSDRTYICSECGIVIDRDLNAAINLQRYSA